MIPGGDQGPRYTACLPQTGRNPHLTVVHTVARAEARADRGMRPETGATWGLSAACTVVTYAKADVAQEQRRLWTSGAQLAECPVLNCKLESIDAGSRDIRMTIGNVLGWAGWLAGRNARKRRGNKHLRVPLSHLIGT